MQMEEVQMEEVEQMSSIIQMEEVGQILIQMEEVGQMSSIIQMEELMQQMAEIRVQTLTCTNASRNLWRSLKANGRLLGIIRIPERHPDSYAFRVTFCGENVCRKFDSLSISYPSDIYDNRGANPSIIETALFKNGRMVYLSSIGYGDIARFDSVNELVDEIQRLHTIYSSEYVQSAEDNDDSDEDSDEDSDGELVTAEVVTAVVTDLMPSSDAVIVTANPVDATSITQAEEINIAMVVNMLDRVNIASANVIRATEQVIRANAELSSVLAESNRVVDLARRNL